MKGSQLPHEIECNKFGKNSCLSVDCCVWAKYNQDGEEREMCKAGNKEGVVFKNENGDKKKINQILEDLDKKNDAFHNIDKIIFRNNEYFHCSPLPSQLHPEHCP